MREAAAGAERPAPSGVPDAVCPLCNLEFEGETCHASCPMARGCKLVRCPRCGFEFAGEGFLVHLIRRIVPKGFLHDPSAR